MQVVLQKDHHPLGAKGQAINVKPGFYRNFLLPNKIAIAGTKKRLVQATIINDQIKAKQAKIKEEAKLLAEKLKSITITLKEKLTSKGALFAKISVKEIIQALKDNDITLSEDQIILSQPIKKTGKYEITVKLHSNTKSNFTLIVEGLE